MTSKKTTIETDTTFAARELQILLSFEENAGGLDAFVPSIYVC
jgi:hypothetical protein